MLNELLEDTEAILVGGKLVELFHDLLENIVPLLLFESRDYFLKHMVALLVFG